MCGVAFSVTKLKDGAKKAGEIITVSSGTGRITLPWRRKGLIFGINIKIDVNQLNGIKKSTSKSTYPWPTRALRTFIDKRQSFQQINTAGKASYPVGRGIKLNSRELQKFNSKLNLKTYI